jgi:hypothetical protein
MLGNDGELRPAFLDLRRAWWRIGQSIHLSTVAAVQAAVSYFAQIPGGKRRRLTNDRNANPKVSVI